MSRNPEPCYEKATSFGSQGHPQESRKASSGRRADTSLPRANGASRFAYSDARLSASDEARSAALERDPRVYTPDEDETSTRLCGASKHNR